MNVVMYYIKCQLMGNKILEEYSSFPWYWKSQRKYKSSCFNKIEFYVIESALEFKVHVLDCALR